MTALPGDPCPFCPGLFNEDLVCETCWTFVPNGQALEKSKYPELFNVMRGEPFSLGDVAYAYTCCDLPAFHPARRWAEFLAEVGKPFPLQVWELALVCHVCHKGVPDHEPNCLLNSEHVQYVGRHRG